MTKATKKTYRGRENETYKKILAAATELFAERGYDRVGMRDVCEAVGVTLPSIYHYFKDKQNLYREVELSNYGRAERLLLKSMAKNADPESRLRAFMTQLYDLLSNDHSYRNLSMRNMLDPDVDHHKFLVSSALQDLFDQLVELLREVRPNVDAEILAFSLLSGIFGFIVMAPSKQHIEGYPHQRSKRKERDRFINHLLSSISAF